LAPPKIVDTSSKTSPTASSSSKENSAKSTRATAVLFQENRPRRVSDQIYFVALIISVPHAAHAAK
jgi:hypothetical protein